MWTFENDIFDSISSGGIAYELCRPADLYGIWLSRSASMRLSRAVLRCFPILIVAAFLPEPYGLSLPPDIASFFLFVISVLLGFALVVAYTMIIYVSAFYTVSSAGIRVLALSAAEFLSGAIIPLPFLPDRIRIVFELLPFASMQNTPFLIYGGHISGSAAVTAVLLQAFWLGTFLLSGKLMIRHALKRVVVQGG
jgi:ABC-2 type transport system permease protein